MNNPRAGIRNMMLKIQVQSFLGEKHSQHLQQRSDNIPQLSSFKLSLLWDKVIGKLSPMASICAPNHAKIFKIKGFAAYL